MSASPRSFLRSGPPPPRVVLLSDALFFARAVPVSVTGGGDGEADVGNQVELALEGLAPFPLDQLYYGYYWVPGSDRALAFASYRRRFTAEQTAEWDRAEIVLPAFAAVLGFAAEPATTVVLHAPEGLTALHWGQGPVANRVAYHALPAEATEADRAAARDALIRPWGTKTLVELTQTPVAAPGERDGALTFRSGDWVSTFSVAAARALDVRDKEKLAALRRAGRRDVLIWRAMVACLAGFFLLGLGELALFGGGLWLQTKRVRLAAQAPTVEKIAAANEITQHIEDLHNKRLLPLEMITMIDRGRPSHALYFQRATSTTGDLYSITIEGQTPNAAELTLFEKNLQATPGCQSATVKITQTRDNLVSFTLNVTFKPDALKPTPPPT